MTMTPDGYRSRCMDPLIDKMLEAFGAVCIEGPKSCGKTWLALNHASSSIMISDPAGGFENRKLVKLDPHYAFTGDVPHLIDEWQDIPFLWDAVRAEVDRSTDNGRFILTGSSTPVRKGIMHSGAGRIGGIRMRTMSLYESGDSSGDVSLMDLFNHTLQFTKSKKIDLEHLIYLTVRGGWPRNINLKADAAVLANRGYLETCLNDAAALDGKGRNKSKLEMVVRSLARNESSTATVSKILSDVTEGSVSDKATIHYLDVLDRMFLINDQLPFDPNFRSSVRVGKTVKRHLADPSLAAAAMNLTPVKLLKDLHTYGFLFEAMCERDLDVYAQSLGGTLYHYRDLDGREIDAVLELSDGRWGAFEIKLGADQIDEAAKKLIAINKYFESRGARVPSFLCVVCGLSSAAYLREDGVYVVPINCLKN